MVTLRRCRAALMACLVLAAPAHGQTLSAVREDVRTPPPPPAVAPPKPHLAPSSAPSNNENDLFEEERDGLVGGLIVLAGAVVAAPFWVPNRALSDDWELGYFADYPHQYELGYLMVNPPEALGLEGELRPRTVSARARSEVGSNFSRLNWVGAKLQLDTVLRLGVDGDVRYVLESNDGGADSLWLGDANVLFRFAQSERVQFRSGLGVNYLSDRDRTNVGFNFTYGMDWQPSRPWVLSLETDFGTLGHAGVAHLRGTAGHQWRRTETFLGYDSYWIGSTRLQGVVGGLQFWF